MKATTFPNRFEPQVTYSSDFSSGERKYPVIKEKYFDPITAESMGEYKISHSCHSYQRAKNRGLSTQDLWLAIDYGEMNQKQGLIFYLVLDKNLPSSMDTKTKEKINNMVVVTNGDSSQILTCYKSKFASRHIRRKSQKRF